MSLRSRVTTRTPRLRPGHWRPVVLTAAALAGLLAVAPLLPDRETPRPQARVIDQPGTMTATQGKVDAAMQAEIDRVVGEGMRLPRTTARMTPARMASTQVRCAELEGQTYCLGQGWTSKSEAAVQQEVAREVTAAAARRTPLETTGDLSLADELRQRAAMSPQARAKLERAELTTAAKSVAKVWLLRHEIEGTPLPAGFARRHPEARLAQGRSGAGGIRLTAGKTARDYPQRSTVVSSKRVSEQIRSYWCGPGAMQMIGWGWSGTKLSQSTWAGRLGTTTSGTAITRMVAATNRYTGWDRASRAGTYITLDISGYSFDKWWLLMMRHVEDYRAPVILHPLLYKRWFPYLDDDASGHFQMGRGYDKNGADPNLIGYFEPWNQKRFDPSEPYIKRVQWQRAYNSYRANKAHFQHNVGV